MLQDFPSNLPMVPFSEGPGLSHRFHGASDVYVKIPQIPFKTASCYGIAPLYALKIFGWIVIPFTELFIWDAYFYTDSESQALWTPSQLKAVMKKVFYLLRVERKTLLQNLDC